MRRSGWSASRIWPSHGIATNWRPAAFAPRTSKHCSSSNWARARRRTSRAWDRGSISGARWCCTAFLPPRARALVDPRRNRGVGAIPHRCAGERAIGGDRCARTDRSRGRRTAGGAPVVERVPRGGAAGRQPARPAPETPVRHRDWLLAVHGIDTDAWIHPPLIRFLAGYLDQGLAHWSMPERDLGFTAAFWRSTARWRRSAAVGRERSPASSPTTTPPTERARLDRTFSRSARCR